MRHPISSPLERPAPRPSCPVAVSSRWAWLSPRGDARRRPDIRRSVGWGLALGLSLLVAAPGLTQANPFASPGDPFSGDRQTMVNEQVRKRGIEAPGLLAAMEAVPRHLFVPDIYQVEAYEDTPVSIAPGQTLSQAYVSARMIALLDLDGDERVLEIGTGSGYDAALLSRVAKEVYTIEIDDDLGSQARSILDDLGYDNVKVRIGDGYRGWPEKAPFDAILITTAPERLPEPLVDQLKVGGKMVVAVGRVVQELQVLTKGEDGIGIRKVSLVNLTPMTGEVQQEN